MFVITREGEQKRTGRSKDDATSAEQLSPGLICLPHGGGRMLDGEKATSQAIRANPQQHRNQVHTTGR